MFGDLTNSVDRNSGFSQVVLGGLKDVHPMGDLMHSRWKDQPRQSLWVGINANVDDGETNQCKLCNSPYYVAYCPHFDKVMGTNPRPMSVN